MNLLKLCLIISLFTYSITSRAFTLVSNVITAGWDTTSLTFDVNEASCTALGITSAQLNTAIDAAIELWNKNPTSSLKLVKGTTVSTTSASSPPSISCSNASQSDGTAGVGTIGSTLGGHPYTGNLVLNGDNTKSAYFGNLTATEQAIVVAHEIGHVLGLGHSEKEYALMYYDISSKENLNLSQDDIDGLTWLNPRNELSSGLMGCGTIEDIHTPPSNGMNAVALNWILLVLVMFVTTRLVRRPVILKTDVRW